MDTNNNADTQTHRIHSCKKKLGGKRRRDTSEETKISHGQLARTGYSQKQILELKRTTTLPKQSPLYELKGYQNKPFTSRR